MITAIILAAGNSTRLNQKTPKQFIKINNKRIVDYSIKIFEKYVDSIIVVVPIEWKETIQTENPSHKIIPGGKTRKESSYLGLLKCDKSTKKVLIHDAARPFVKKKYIVDCINKLDNYDAVSTVVNPIDTIVETNQENNKIIEVLERELYKLEQTPQGFIYNIILDAHKKIKEDTTDDIKIAHKYGVKCGIIDGAYSNFKVTTDFDYQIAQLILKDK